MALGSLFELSAALSLVAGLTLLTLASIFSIRLVVEDKMNFIHEATTSRLVIVALMVAIAVFLTAADEVLTRFNDKLARVVGTRTDVVMQDNKASNETYFEQALSLAGSGNSVQQVLPLKG